MRILWVCHLQHCNVQKAGPRLWKGSCIYCEQGYVLVGNAWHRHENLGWFITLCLDATTLMTYMQLDQQGSTLVRCCIVLVAKGCKMVEWPQGPLTAQRPSREECTEMHARNECTPKVVFILSSELFVCKPEAINRMPFCSRHADIAFVSQGQGKVNGKDKGNTRRQ